MSAPLPFSDVDPLCNLQSIVNFNSKIPNCTFDLCVTEQ